MRAQTRRQWFGVGLLLLITAVVILGYCLWQTFQLRSQVSATTDFTLTLTRLAQLNADVDNGSASTADYTTDDAARLVAAGDVQSRSIQQLAARGGAGVLAEQGPELVALWSQVRRAFSIANVPTPSTVVTDNEPLMEINGLPSVLQTYEQLFEAIVRESLSQPLLSLASEIRGDLLALELLSAARLSGEDAGQLVGKLNTHAQQLEAVARPESGPSILGYQSTLKLNEFLRVLSGLVVTQTPQSPAVVAVSAATGSGSVLSDATAAGLSFAQSLLLSMEAELVESRRNVLLASLLLSLCVLLSALLGWSVKRQNGVAAERKKSMLAALQFDMDKLADGEFTHRSTVPQGSPQAVAVAAAFNRAAGAVAELQQLSTFKLKQSSALAVRQQEVVELMEERLAALVKSSADRSEAFNGQLSELQEWVSAFSTSFSERHAELGSQVNDTASSLTRLTAQLELCSSRIDRATILVNSLQDSLGRIEDSSRQSSLTALNESIKQSGYYTGQQETERFVERTQRVSHQLQIAADKAAHDVGDIRTDLDTCSNSLRECLVAAQKSAQRVSGASRMIQSYSSTDSTSAGNLDQLHTLVSEVTTALQQATTVNTASLPEEELLYLKGHALELQLLVAEFSRKSTDQLQSEDQA